MTADILALGADEAPVGAEEECDPPTDGFFVLLAVVLPGGLAAYRWRRPSRRPKSRANSKRVTRRKSLPLRAV